ncbi:MAG: hypothetical protein AMXMBFR58_00460 [Phycisphaerae bacterium]
MSFKTLKRILGRLPADREARAAALSAAIRMASGDEQPPLIERLVECATAPPLPIDRLVRAVHAITGPLGVTHQVDHGRTIVHVVAVWDHLTHDLRRLLLASAGRSVLTAARACRGAANPAVRRATVLALHDIATAESFTELVQFLTDDDAAVAGAADRALVALIERWSQDWSAGPDRRAIGEALVAAINAVGDERLAGPYTALITLGSPRHLSAASADMIPAVARWLGDASARNVHMGRILRGSRTPESRARAWQWLSRGPVASACVDRLERAYTIEDHEVILSAMHLAVNPRRCAAMRAIGRSVWTGAARARVSGGEVAAARTASIRSGGPVPRPDQVPELSPRSKWGLSQWVGLIAAPASIRREMLAPLLSDPSPGVRLSAARHVPAADLADFCFDEDPAVARSAMNRWSLIGAEGRLRNAALRGGDRDERIRLLGRLARSPHASLRRAAHVDMARISPAAEINGPESSCAWVWCATEDPSRVLPSLESLILQDDAQVAAAAVRTAQRAGFSAALQERLIDRANAEQSAGHGDPSMSERLVATIIAALSSVAPADRSPRCERTLAGALAHTDARVRSNAVDGIARDARRQRLAADATPLIELKNDAHHRVRGSALRGLIWLAGPTESSAFEAMMGMLDDHRADHRLAAVWLAERWTISRAGGTGDFDAVVHSLQERAESDDDPRVSGRAARAQRRARLIAGLPESEAFLEHSA